MDGGTGSITFCFLQSMPLVVQKVVKSLIRERGRKAEVNIDTVSRNITPMNSFKKRKNYFKKKELRDFHCMSFRTCFDTVAIEDQFNKLSAMG